MLAWTATPDRFAFNKSSTLSQQRIRRLAEAEKENWHKRSVHANLQNVTRNLERAKRRLRISRPGVRVPSIAPNQENPNLFPIGEGFGFFVFFGGSVRGGYSAPHLEPHRTPPPNHSPAAWMHRRPGCGAFFCRDGLGRATVLPCNPAAEPLR